MLFWLREFVGWMLIAAALVMTWQALLFAMNCQVEMANPTTRAPVTAIPAANAILFRRASF